MSCSFCCVESPVVGDEEGGHGGSEEASVSKPHNGFLRCFVPDFMARASMSEQAPS